MGFLEKVEIGRNEFPKDVDHTGTSNALLAKVGHEYVEDKQETTSTSSDAVQCNWVEFMNVDLLI